MPANTSGKPVVNALIDPYRKSAIDPDQLLAVIGKCLLEYGLLRIKESSALVLLDSLQFSPLQRPSLGHFKTFSVKERKHSISDIVNYILPQSCTSYCYKYIAY